MRNHLNGIMLQRTCAHRRTWFVSLLCAVLCCVVLEGVATPFKRHRTATHCNTLQHTATHCNRCASGNYLLRSGSENWRERLNLNGTAHCNTLQHAATHCNRCALGNYLLRSGSANWRRRLNSNARMSWYAVQHAATHCNALQHTATHCNTPQHDAPHCNTATHYNTHALNTPFSITSCCN